MKRFFILISVFVISSSAILAADAGTVTQVTTKQGPVIKTVFTWTSGTNDTAVGTGTVKVSGEILRVVFDPTSTKPTSYAVTMKDQNGIDLLVGAGTSMPTNSVTSIRPAIVMASGVTTNLAPYAVNDLFTIAVTNCGNNKSGTITVYSK